MRNAQINVNVVPVNWLMMITVRLTGCETISSSEILKKKILQEKAKGKTIIITSHILNELDDLATHVMYLQEGTIRLFSTLEDVVSITGEQRLNKAIAMLMQHNFYNGNLHAKKV